MSQDCFAYVRGSALRVTGLTPAGALPVEPRYAVSKSITSVTINENVEEGRREVLRNDEDQPRLQFVTSGTPTSYGADITFIHTDPAMLSLITGLPLVVNAAGDIAGFDASTRVIAKSFALEVWTKVGRQPGLTSGFGISPMGSSTFGDGGSGGFGSGDNPPEHISGYTLFPFLKGGRIGGFSISNGLVSFTVKGAKTRRFSKWGAGPYDLTGSGAYGLEVPVSRNTHWRSILIPGRPPEPTCGVVSQVRVIDGQNVVTSADIVDGQTTTTSPDTIEGGSAA